MAPRCSTYYVTVWRVLMSLNRFYMPRWDGTVGRSDERGRPHFREKIDQGRLQA